VDTDDAATASNILISCGMVAISTAVGGLFGVWVGLLVAGIELVVAGALIAWATRPVAIEAQGPVDSETAAEVAT
jgi:hypothetical protein